MTVSGARVLHLVKTGAGATWAVRLVREQVRAGFDVHVLVPDGPRSADYAEVGATVHCGSPDLFLSMPRVSWRSANQLRRIVHEVKPTLLHSHFVGSTILARLALGRGGPARVFQVPGPLHLERELTARAELVCAHPHDHWIGSCEWTVREYRRRGIDGGRVALAYYGTDIAHEPPPHTPGTLHHVINVPSSARLVGIVAYLYAPKRWLGQSRGLKGHEDLIDAFDRIAARHPDVHLVCIGGAWNGATAYEEAVRGYAMEKGAGRIHFTGTRSDVAALYQDLSVAVHPSHSENVGGAAESLMLGIPTIATRVGGLVDLVKDPETGWLVPPKDPEALAHALREALANSASAQARAERGRALARRLLDIRHTAQQVTDAYRRFGLLRD